MNTAKQVQQLIDELVAQLKQDVIPISDAIWQVALACVAWPYVFGAWGEECTPANRRRRERDDHPTIKSACQVLRDKDRKSNCTGCQWLPDGFNVRMFDCRGFTDWCLKQFGIDLIGEGATTQWKTESNWSAKGEIRDGMPNDVIVCLFVKNGTKMSHTGFGYRGQTVECSHNVEYHDKQATKWTHWAVPRGVDGSMEYKPTLRKGSTGPYVVECQEDLISLGYDVGKSGADGKYGTQTAKAVTQFQKDHPPLVADGVCGPATWTELDAACSGTRYTVTIPHLTKYQADSLVQQYAGATMTEEGSD